MKKLALLILAFCVMSSVAFADSLGVIDTLKKVSALKQGIAYSIVDSKFTYLSTFEILNYKGFNLEAGYSSNDKAVAVLSYPLFKLKDLGVTLPILDLVDCKRIWQH